MERAEDYIDRELQSVDNEEIYKCVENYADVFALKFMEFFSEKTNDMLSGFDFEEMLERFKNTIE